MYYHKKCKNDLALLRTILEDVAMENKRKVYSPNEIREFLGVGNSAVWDLLYRSKHPIPHFRIGKKIVIPCDLFDQWMIQRALEETEADMQFKE